LTFNSVTFLCFLALVLLLHNLPLGWRAKKRNLLIASYLFYATWNPPFVVLIWISTGIDWWVAARIARTDDRHARRGLLLVSLFANLGLLGYFKYGAFLLDSFAGVLAATGIAYQPAAPDVILPVGISFYTFQTLSYTIDVYRGRMQPWRSFLDYALYVTFFPQLVAGPIVRAAEFLPQCLVPKTTSWRGLSYGGALLVLGLFEKVVLADGLLAPIAEAVYDTAPSADAVSALSAWSGTLAFSGQIFCDFAGYSTCAIGVAHMLGFTLPENFHAPYASVGFSDFWRRWHISLSTWLRDYLYIPLGGNRQGVVRTYANLAITMLVGGLWHGASWTFVAWGALHGLYLVVERVARRHFGLAVGTERRFTRLALGGITFVVVTFTWVFFRADTFSRAFSLAGAMLGLRPGGEAILDAADVWIACTTVAALLLGHALMRHRSLPDLIAQVPRWTTATALACMLVAIVTSNGEDRAFIYFQF